MRLLALLFLLCALSSYAACQRYIIDFEAGVNGQTVTTNAILSSVHGSTPSALAFGYHNDATGMTFDTAGQKAFLSPVTNCTGSISGAGALGLKHSAAYYTNYIRLFAATPSASATAGTWFYTDLPYTSSVNFDVLTVHCDPTIDYVNLDLIGETTQFRLALENFSGTTPVIHGLQNNTWYWLAVAYQVNGSNIFSVYDANTNLVGTGGAAYSSAHTATCVRDLNSTPTPGTYDAYNCWYDGIVMDFSDSPQWPLLPTGPVPIQNIITGGSVLRNAVLQ